MYGRISRRNCKKDFKETWYDLSPYNEVGH